jgi:hypothetical protein
MVDFRYFARLPAAGPKPGRRDGWTLPHDTAFPPEEQLLGALFTLVRHGQAHQGQQTMALLSDGNVFGVSLDGVHRTKLSDVEAEIAGGDRPKMHLRVDAVGSGATWIIIKPEVLFLDVKAAVDRSGIVNEGLSFDYLEQDFAFDTTSLRASLAAAGLKAVNEPP